MRQIDKAVQVLNNGGIVIFSTDTAYAIGCRADNTDSVAKLFSIRKRPKNKAVPVLVDSIAMAKKYWTTPLTNIVRRLTKKYWPGAVTIVYTAQAAVTPPLLRGGSDTIGLRIPNHTMARALITSVGVGLVGTSANFAKSPTPYRFEDIHTDLLKRVDYVVQGSVSTKKSSTVIDCSTDSAHIIRKGAVDLQGFLKRTVTVHIDTADSANTIVALQVNNTDVAKEELGTKDRSQNALPLVQKILQKEKYTLNDVTNITVNTGPGSFTGLRIGMAVANTLSWVLQVPVNGRKPPLTPKYTPSQFDV